MMADTPQSSGSPTISTPVPPQGGGVRVVVDAEDSVPFEINPAFVSLGLKPTVFKKEMGGDAS